MRQVVGQITGAVPLEQKGKLEIKCDLCDESDEILRELCKILGPECTEITREYKSKKITKGEFLKKMKARYGDRMLAATLAAREKLRGSP